jgi:hypothetical protein
LFGGTTAISSNFWMLWVHQDNAKWIQSKSQSRQQLSLARSIENQSVTLNSWMLLPKERCRHERQAFARNMAAVISRPSRHDKA